jgi:cob(I)alamin adenosyltransferase
VRGRTSPAPFIAQHSAVGAVCIILHMVVLTKIYTRTGDDGSTSLGRGERVPKHHLRVAAYGAVDETNAAIGLALLQLDPGETFVRASLGRIQNDLFDVGADLCVRGDSCASAYAEGAQRVALRVTAAQTERLEREIDQMNAELRPLASFVLPGGTLAGASLHVARTVCRRAERAMCELAAQPDEPVSRDVLRYVNRLSDLLFVASRFVNGRGALDVLWRPGENRG